MGSAGYRFLRGAPFGEPVNEAKVPEMKVGFVEKIRELEVLQRHHRVEFLSMFYCDLGLLGAEFNSLSLNIDSFLQKL